MIGLVPWVGCQDFLEQEPGSQISISEQLSNYPNVLIALNGSYMTLQEWMTGDRQALYADLLGGNITFTPASSGNSKGVVGVPFTIERAYSFGETAEENGYEGFYNEGYALIHSVNLLLEQVDALKDATPEQINQVKAECYAIRAFVHFGLVRVFGQNYTYTPDGSHPGIVYNVRTLRAGYDFPVRETVQTTYSLVLADFEKALTLYTGNNALPGPDYSYFNAINTRSLMARVALYAGQWQRAIDRATEVIAESGLSLMTPESYVTQWAEPNAPVSEVLFELSAPIGDDGRVEAVNTAAQHFGYTSATVFSRYVASGDLLNLFEAGDVRGTDMYLMRDIETLVEDNLVGIPYYFTKKFQDNPGYPVIRLSELYLIRAEASARLELEVAALDDLNQVRIQRGATPAPGGDNLLEEIFLERRRELCFEGHLFYDIARFHKDVVRNQGCIATLCNLSYPSDYYVLPLPKSNIDLNSNLEQNEGY